MEKEYLKPEVEEITLVTEEPIATDADGDGWIDGETGLESSIF